MTARRRGRRPRAQHGVVLAAAGLGGTALLGISLSTKPGSPRFYILTMGLASTWAAGAISSGPLPLRRPGARGNARLVAMPVLTSTGAFGLFYGAARLARHLPRLNRAVGNVLSYADRGSMPLVLLTASANAVAEELFFHGALWPAPQQPHPIATTTLAYAAATTATRNPALVLAGTATSILFGLQRHATGGVLAPALSHLTWSILMLTCLPRAAGDPYAGCQGERAQRGKARIDGPAAAGPGGTRHLISQRRQGHPRPRRNPRRTR